MPQYYRLSNPAVSSLSVDGVEFSVNGDGLLEVGVETPGLKALLAHHGAVEAEPPTEEERQRKLLEDDERNQLFLLLDEAHGRRIDRRRSVQQLRKMWEDWQEKRPKLSGVAMELRPEEVTGDV